MNFVFDTRLSDSPFVEAIWHTRHAGGGSFISTAASQWEMVITKQNGKITFTVRGPETKASLAPIPENAEFFGIIFKHGTFMPYLPAKHLVNGGVNLPGASSKSFWLNGSAWEFPGFENADTFVERLARSGLLARDDVVQSVLQNQSQAVSQRSVQRRFLYVTGVTYKAVQQIERARRALALLQKGTPILDVVYEAGYFDQSHLTNALKRFAGQTPAQILRPNQPD
jgi:AraC-like DNA-binding protein